MDESFRLSRLKTPRSTVTAVVLLALVFLLFGFAVNALAPEQLASQEPYQFDGTSLPIANWLLGGRS